MKMKRMDAATLVEAKLLRKLGWSIRDLANSLGVSKSAAGRALKGESNSPLSNKDKKEGDQQVLSYLKDRAAGLDLDNSVARSRGIAVNAARDRLFLEQTEASLSKLLYCRYYVGKEYRPLKSSGHAKTQRILNLVLSDLHYGALLDKREVPTQYGHVEEARRTAAVVLQASEYKLQYRDETELYVHLLGDLIQNQLHDMRDGAPLAEQVASAIHLLVQAVVFLSGRFKKVTVFCTPGNHGRNTARHPDRATCQKWDSIESMIYFAIKTAVKHIHNVTVELPYTPFYTYKAFGMSGFMTHGDTVLRPGYPNRAIEVEGVRKQINEINAKLELNERHRLFVVGHVHVASYCKLPNGVVFMSNGCLIPTDAYAQSIGITETACCQSLFETVPGIMVGDRREADVDESVDRDHSLDRIIQPFTGL